MGLIIHECEQGTDEWFQCRQGIATASEFKTVLAKGRGNSPSQTRLTYLRKLAGERLTNEPKDNHSNAHMERGHEMEPDARNLYSFMHDCEVEEIGFATNHGAGCSPDGLVGDSGLIEIKTKLPHLQIAVLEADRVPSEHMAQCQGALWVLEREWIDFISYWPSLPPFIKRVTRDEEYIKTLADEVAKFNDELEALVARIENYGNAA